MSATATFIDGLRYDENGLIPAIAQQHDTGEVLMMAWMNRASIQATLEGGRVVYWSRSRQSLWRKGDSSGQIQRLVELRADCDQDCLLLLVDQIGPACHTGRRSCFYTALRDDSPKIIADVLISPEKLYQK
ncbi:phosphoribosyl-AMP cyclohydrolase [Dongia sp.]|uniref:phosphoribosyl-AMP cyclohydrolase n=1 Tax=Dongia sp. TaxID=1977262 RepID=UPI0035B2C9EA